MKKFNSFLLGATLIAAMSFTSCKDTNSIFNSDLNEETASEQPVEVKGKFSSLMSQKQIDELLVKHSDELKKWESESHESLKFKTLETNDFILTELPTTYSGRVNAINDNGVAVGTDNGKGFIWENGTQTILPSIYNSSDQALDINNNDVVVGHSRIPGGNFEGYVWSSSSGLQRLGLPVPYSVYRYSLSSGEAINNNDIIAGYATFTANGGYNGFVNQVDNQITNADPSGSYQYSTLNDINDNGDAIGRVYSPATSWVAATWTAADGFSILTLSGINSAFLAAINKTGDITGRGYNNSGNYAFLRKADGTLVEISASSDICTSNCTIEPFDINDANIVVGRIRLPGGFLGLYKPFVWTEEGGMTLLPTITPNGFIHFNAALSINENGDIAGYSMNSSFREVPVIWSSEELAGPVNTTPVADAGADQSVIATGQATSITLNGSASSDADGDALSYSWSVNGSEVATGVSPTVQLALGSYIYTLTVTDPSGESSSDDVSVEVLNVAPEAVINAGSAVLGSSVSFSASASSDANGDALSYAWDFGDGNTATGENVTHDFSNSGNVSVTLTVTDPYGATGTANATISIAGRPYKDFNNDGLFNQGDELIPLAEFEDGKYDAKYVAIVIPANTPDITAEKLDIKAEAITIASRLVAVKDMKLDAKKGVINAQNSVLEAGKKVYVKAKESINISGATISAKDVKVYAKTDLTAVQATITAEKEIKLKGKDSMDLSSSVLTADKIKIDSKTSLDITGTVFNAKKVDYDDLDDDDGTD